MGKVVKTEYICDRCGKNISETPFHIGRFRYLHVFKWWNPEPVNGYLLRYICKDCFDSFKEWYRKTDGERRYKND